MISEDKFYGGAQYITAASGGSYPASAGARVITVEANALGVILDLPDPRTIQNGAIRGGPVFYVVNSGTQVMTVRDDTGVTLTVAVGAAAPIVMESEVMMPAPAPLPSPPTTPVLGAIIAGGGQTGLELATVERFAYSTETFSVEVPMTTARAEGAAAQCKQGFYIAQSRGGSSLAEKHRLGVWAALPNISSARENGLAGALDATIYMLGGSAATTEALDVVTDIWSARSAVPYLREGSAAATMPGADRVVMISGDDPAKIALAYHAPTDTYESLDPYPGTLRGQFTAFAHDGRIILVGGADNVGGLLSIDVDQLDVVSRIWSVGATIGVAREELGSWVAGDRAGYVGGGKNLAGTDQAGVYRLSGRGGAWATVGATLGTARSSIANQCAGGVI